MLANRSLRNILLVTSLALAFFGLAAVAAQQAGAGGGQDKAVTLAYQFPEGKALAYRDVSTETQNMEVMGQSITVKNLASREFSIKPKGLKEGNYLLGVTIDAFKQSTESPQGGLSADASTVTGKSFDMTLSRLGKEIDLAGASSIQYDLGAAGRRNLGAAFQTFFPDLPDRPVKTGDTWPSEDTVVDKSDMSTTRVVIKLVNTVDGFETVDGYECVRIKTTGKGTLTGSMEQSGTSFTVDGSVEGSMTWYFAIKEGIYVKADQKQSVAGTVTAGEPANLVIPITGENQEEIRLIKK
jgi:hypothetical protein